MPQLFSPKGLRSFFNTHNYDEWKLVRKATAPAFSPAEIRKAFPLLLKARRPPHCALGGAARC